MVLTTLVAAVALGIAAQVISERFQVPAILPLLVLGITLGPAGIALFEPASLGEVFKDLIHVGVAIILFEGGLSLDPRHLLKVGAAVRNLLTVGMAITAAGCALLAHLLVGMPWSTAALFGAIMTVTGPTVIVPLLRHMIASRPVKTILVSEGLMIDPIGAVLAYLVLQGMQRADMPWREFAGALVELGLTGTILGFAAGALCKVIIRTRVVGGELRNLSVLALLMLCYLVAEEQAPQSGILASVVMGFTVSASELPDLVSLKAFKGQLSTLIISMLFILLAGKLDVAAITNLGWGGVLVVTGMIVLVRPLSVAASVWPSHLQWRDRLLIALTAPRGIVAAAVASLAALSLREAGIGGGNTFEGLVYLTILATCAFSTLVALVVPRLLGIHRDPSRLSAVLVGANSLTEMLADQLSRCGRKTVVIDGVAWRLERFRSKGYRVVTGDARDSATYNEAGVERDSLVIAATTNDELNLLVAELVRDQFGVEHPVAALQRPPDELGRLSRAWLELLGGRGLDIPAWIRRLENGTAVLLEINPRVEEAEEILREVDREHDNDVIRLLGSADNTVSFDVRRDRLAELESLALLVHKGKALDMLQPLARSQVQNEPLASESNNSG